jgi:ATP-dependent helicase/nuclease subunit A
MSKALTEPQRRAVDPATSAWVEASAGTGKTQVLTARVLRLLLAGTAPARILCLTFTKAAAAEMRTRVADELGLWATADDATLESAFAALGEAPPDAARLARARRLFARVLDAPGGLKIMTIHAFCQSILQRFPVEAGLAPHFAVLDEVASAELMRAAQDALLRAEGAAPGLGDPLRLVAEQVDEERFAELMRLLARERGRLARALEAHGGIEGLARAIYARHGMAGVAGDEALAAAAAGEGAFDRAALAAACRALLSGSATDQERGQAIAAWLGGDAALRAATIDGYARAFLTDAGTVRTRLATKGVEERHPGTVAALQREAERLSALAERRRAFAVARASEAIARLGDALLARYARAKRDAAALDYDDLIEATCRLLAQPGVAPWVLFKLDGGLDHILIDEAQDTSPAQWRVVQALAEEFFAGMGARETVRTVFAVGDPKQSIFSFQGADPRAFDAMRRHFADRVRAAGADWRDEVLETSFRSAPPVLALVDAVFALDPAREGVVAPGRVLTHKPHRKDDAGLVEIWPIAARMGEEQPEAWAPPTERSETDVPRARLAERIAQQIADWVAYPRTLPSRERPIRPGDIMILVRRRDALVEELVRALKARQVAVAGADRMVLTKQLAVMDLMALGSVLLLPDDDLTLATVLKSPLFGFDDDRLFALAHGRPGRLWPALNARAAADPAGPEAQALAELDWLMNRADFVSPHALYAEVLSARGGRAKLLERLGPDAADPLDEFLAAALAYERSHPPSLQGFLNWLGAGAAEIKRDLDQATRDEVRIMTVHGAKGLQAPIVILPDTAQMPRKLDPLLWSEDGAPIWVPRAEMADAVARSARDTAKSAQDREYRRLLYVALTRAEDRIYVTGWRGANAVAADCWYSLIQAGADRLQGAAPLLLPDDLTADGWEGRALVAQSAQLTLGRRRAAPAGAAAVEPLPDWARRPPPPEPDPPRPLVPSRPEPEEGEPPVLAPFGGQQRHRFRRGRLIHRLLQVLPALPPARRRDAAATLVRRLDRDLPEAACAEIAEAALRVIEAPDLAALFGPGSRAEAPIVGQVGGRILSGQIDRIVVAEDRVLIVDYKTNRPPPARVEDVPAAYLRQMAAYRAAIAAVYPGRPVAAALLWTDGPFAMMLPDAVLDRFDPSRERDPAPP